MSRGPTVTIAGAGALGLSIALGLAEAGCLVTVRDPGDRGSASAVAAGMLAPVFETVLDDGASGDINLLLAARNLWPSLAARAGVVLDRSGTVAAGSETWLHEVRAGLARLGVHGSDLPEPMLRDLAPRIAPDLQGLLVREDWRLEPGPALIALRGAAAAAGVQFHAEATRERGEADWLVIATGADRSLADFAPELACLSPIKGQILSYAGVRSGRVSLRGEGVYAVPGSLGLAVGATMEPGRADTKPDMTALAPLIAAAEGMFPGLRGATFGVAAGVRAATADGLPLVGLSKTSGVIVAVGARRNGWLLSPLVARIVTACAMGRDAGPYAGRLDPARFDQSRLAGRAT